jgi:NAD(P)-dependent dehydrogenase (short-subunit alcohol dehydrogenase family)
VVRRFREEGAEVVVADLVGGDVEVDVRSAASVTSGVSEAASLLGGLTTVVCNAGRPVLGPVSVLNEAEWDDGAATNLKGVYLTAKAAWPYLVESRGCVLSTASTLGLMAVDGQAAYCAFKAGVIMLTKCLALDGAKAGIRANCVCPGMIETAMLKGIFEEQSDPAAARAAAVGYHPIGRLGRPLDIADAFVYLASDDAAWITGVALVVDGGFTVGKQVHF